MLQQLGKTGQVVVILLWLCVPTAAALSAVQGPTADLKPAITDSPIRAGRTVQLGAWRSEAEARAAWLAITARTGGLLARLEPDILAVDLAGRGRYYRLRVLQPDSRSAAKLCAALKAKRLACVMLPD